VRDPRVAPGAQVLVDPPEVGRALPRRWRWRCCPDGGRRGW
jgi:hypothetical protein